MHGTWSDAIATIYDGLAQRGITPRMVDDCALWEVAAMLGANRAPEDGEDIEAEVRDWNAQRAYALEHGLPEPTWDDLPPVSPTAVPFLQEGLIGPITPN